MASSADDYRMQRANRHRRPETLTPLTMIIDSLERARRALTRVPPSYPLNDAVVSDVAGAIRDAVRAGLLEAAALVNGRTHEGVPLNDATQRRTEAQQIAQQLEKLARAFK